jgi:hypothetical protein
VLKREIKFLFFVGTAVVLVLCIFIGKSAGDPDEFEQLKKKVKSTIEFQLLESTTPVYKYYAGGIVVRDLICVPKNMMVPDEFNLQRSDLLIEPHKSRYSVKVIKNGACDIRLYGLKVKNNFRSYELLSVKDNKAYASVKGIVILNGNTLDIHEEGQPPEGYKVYTCLDSITGHLRIYKNPYVHALAMLIGMKRFGIVDLEYELKSYVEKMPANGKELLEKAMQKSKKGLVELTKKGQLMAETEKSSSGEAVAAIYERMKKSGITRERQTDYNPKAGLLIEYWYDRDNKTTNANAVADIECLVELTRIDKTDKWKVEKIWLLSELEIHNKDK